MDKTRLCLIENEYAKEDSLFGEYFPTEDEVNAFIALTWYEDDAGNLYINWDDAEKAGLEFLLIEDSREPVGELVEIDFPLKRYNGKDGFYHA